MQMDDFRSIGQIERALLKHDTSRAFVLPDVIADIVHDPALRYANGTAVYHVVAEPYCKYILYYEYTK